MNIKSIFRRKFDLDPEYVFWSPGRVNIIGEHTDYHDGYVMPVAINLGITWAVSRRKDNIIKGYSEKLNKINQFKISDKKRTKNEWLLYLQGVVEIMKVRGGKIGGLNFAISSTIPIGSGLSSSSSLSTGFAFILNEVFQLGFTRPEIAKIACEAEWWYGTTGGIMDQFCIANGKIKKAILLDCRSLVYEEVSIPKNIEIVVFETTIRHKQIDSPFDLRRKQAYKVIEIAQKRFSKQKINKLRDLTLPMMELIYEDLIKKHGKTEGEISYRRARHPITENMRVLMMKDALKKGDLSGIKNLLAESHESLRNDYEVSCSELDRTVEIAHTLDGIIGSRMIGGGFGGCVLCLVKKGKSVAFAKSLEKIFKKEVGIKGRSYVCLPSDGVCRMSY